MEIANFPNFKKLELSDKEIIDRITSQYPPYSDYNFASLWSYNTENDAKFSFIDNNLVIQFRDYITNDPFLSFLGNSNISETIKKLLNYAKNQSLSQKLKLIPDAIINADESILNMFDVKEDRDNFDYIYDLEVIKLLEGPLYSNKRNKISKFVREYPEASITLLDLSNQSSTDFILKVFAAWETSQEKTDTFHERKALCRLLEQNQIFNLRCICITIKSEIKAFSIAEILPNHFSVIHFSKADTSYTGIFEYLYKNVAQKLWEEGCHFLNREQDLGIENLRESKRSWNHIGFLKKYTISHLEI